MPGGDQRLADRDGAQRMSQLPVARLVTALDQRAHRGRRRCPAGRPRRAPSRATPGNGRSAVPVAAATSLSKVVSDQLTKPSGGLRRTTFRFLAASSPALATARSFSMTCSGASTTTSPATSKPARPARPAIWWNSRADSNRVRRPSYLRQRRHQHGPDRDVDPDAEGVRPADHLEQPGLGELLHQSPVLGQHAGVVHADAVPDQPGQRPAEARARTGNRRSPRRSGPVPPGWRPSGWTAPGPAPGRTPG